MEGFDQGTVLYGMRSLRYPDVECYGVIISASCDIANEKVSKLYYLVGVKAQEWFSTEYAYAQVYGEYIKNLFKNFNAECAKYSLNAELMQNFSHEEVEQIILAEGKKDKANLLKSYEKYTIFCNPNMTTESRQKAIVEDSKPIKSFLKNVAKEHIFHYYYLPEDSYLENGKKDSGLIIDLQEIDSLPMEDVSKIKSPGIDKLILSTYGKDERLRLEKKYFLEKDDDFVAIEGRITSPWREHLMQRFSHDFIRIGLDGATDKDYEGLIAKIKEGVG